MTVTDNVLRLIADKHAEVLLRVISRTFAHTLASVHHHTQEATTLETLSGMVEISFLEAKETFQDDLAPSHHDELTRIEAQIFQDWARIKKEMEKRTTSG